MGFANNGNIVEGAAHNGRVVAGAAFNGQVVFEYIKKQQFTLVTQDLRLEGGGVIDRGVAFGDAANPYPALGTINPNTFRSSNWFIHNPFGANALFVVSVRGNKPANFIEKVTIGRLGVLQTFEVSDASTNVSDGTRTWTWNNTGGATNWGFSSGNGEYIMVIYYKD